MSNDRTTKYDSIIPVSLPYTVKHFGCEMTYDGKTYVGIIDHWAAVHGKSMYMEIVTESYLINELNKGLVRRFLMSLKDQITDAIKDRHAKLAEAQAQGMTKSSIIKG